MQPRQNFVELLSPAGDLNSLKFALQYGADAVYAGAKEFGMRSSCANFSLDEMAEACTLAHGMGRRVYLALNTMPTNEEIERLPELMKGMQQAGVDAFIIADWGVLALAKEHTPTMELHVSTQAGIANFAAANAAFSMGAKRVVLARELTLADIAFIRAKTPPELELEVFVHGAMCMSVSGRCLLSQHFSGRDANRGDCPQSCRWEYTLQEKKRPGQSFPIIEDEKGSYILSADDLCMAPYMDKLIEAGVDSIKIEGRSKSFYYVASATASYRASLNAAMAAKAKGEKFSCPEFVLEELQRTSHRPYSTGFYFGKEGATNSPAQSNYVRDWQFIGVVEACKDGRLYCTQRGKFVLGEELEALLPEGRVVSFTPKHIWDEKDNEITATPHAKMKFSVLEPTPNTFSSGALLRRKSIT